MANTITANSKVQKVKKEPKLEVTNRKERRRVNSKKKGATHVSTYGRCGGYGRF